MLGPVRTNVSLRRRNQVSKSLPFSWPNHGPKLHPIVGKSGKSASSFHTLSEMSGSSFEENICPMQD